jgi:tetratricopeptide (TPR) repeat protein
MTSSVARPTRRIRGLRIAPLLATLAFAAPRLASAQQPGGPPEKFENLKVFPKDIPRDSLLDIMRGFTTALGVRCNYCHVTETVAPAANAPAGAPPREVFRFASDDKPAKNKARFMLRMVDTLNHVTLAKLPDRHNPPVTIGCVTCHHGLPVPATLSSVLTNKIDKFGVDSAVATYAELRKDVVSGKYDFSEESVNSLAQQLAAQGKTADAIALLNMNQTYYPNSATIDVQLGDTYLKAGDKDKAITHFRAALVKRPNDPRVKQRLQQLGVS